MPAILGIDISKAEFDVALVQDGRTKTGVFPNTPQGFSKLGRWLKKQGVETVHACLEATGTYGEALAEFLHATGRQVSVVNPAQIKAYGQSQLVRNKTDQADARLIADFCATQHPALWTPPAPEWKELQALVRHLDSLKTMRQQERNRLSAGLSSATVEQALHEHIAFLDHQIAALEQQIQDHIDHHPDLKRQQDLLKSIPGIGGQTAFILLAEIRSIPAFASARQLAAFAGLSPRQRRSGTSVRGQTRLTKTGSARLRKALYMPAIVAWRFNPLIATFCQRLAARGKPKMVILGAAMRKLLHLVYGVLKSGQPFDPDYASKAAS
jgi:transposase